MGFYRWGENGMGQTNYERVKNMGLDDLAAVIMCPHDVCPHDDCPHEEPICCVQCCKEWLESEVSESE